jgi:hypothetical protein
MTVARRQHASPAPPDEIPPEELALIELLAKAHVERDYPAARTAQGESREDRPLRPL